MSGSGPEASTSVPAVPLTDETRKALTFQDYDRARSIAGVWIRPVRKHRAENGWFAELLRLADGAVEDSPGGALMTIRQLSTSYAAPGRINAFHIHPKRGQNELWTVLQGQLLVWLVDCRAESATEGVRQRVVLSGEEPEQLHIPAGVAHGYRAGMEGALLIYAMDRQFDAADPDEGRLPWHHFGVELWEEDRG
ncbi:MAG TPA: dTDP-4-dehydrorhamnose 3,5-epimerase family protein [Longimicrobiaceae bacterium]|nr:dTDP-4-dehydrorhamnose 3,5-epimerase family protein [Longimicrobiaceae bacterium]